MHYQILLEIILLYKFNCYIYVYKKLYLLMHYKILLEYVCTLKLRLFIFSIVCETSILNTNLKFNFSLYFPLFSDTN